MDICVVGWHIEAEDDNEVCCSWEQQVSIIIKLKKTVLLSNNINKWGWVSYNELWRSLRVLSVEAVGRGR